jgi:polysaccharide deacetylase family protein (PEP-CTERM system associated)
MNILTIDLEEWFHAVFETDPAGWNDKKVRIYHNTEFLLKTLKEHNLKATFFVVGWIARQHPDLIKRIHQEGFEIGSHSDNHRTAYMFTKAEFKDDVKRSIESLEMLTGEKIKLFRAPYFSITNSTGDYLETLLENGIEIDSSICCGVTKYGGFKDFKTGNPCLINFGNSYLKEYPMSTYQFFNRHLIFSGGGYFRLLPLFIIKMLLKKLPYNMTYFHPHDFDEAPPAMDISFKDNIRRTIGTKAAQNKFKRMLSSVNFIDIAASNQITNWSKVPVINL